MTALTDRLADLIAETGPISVADYMATCLFDPEHGYYTTREPFGVKGDFTTAPEISQMFGELIGVWALSAWRALGRPDNAVLAEIGPGRGTLMKDMLRTISKIEPAMAARTGIALVETSPRLASIQKKTLRDAGFTRPVWVRHIGELDARPLVVVANELFDALPLRQFVKTSSGWRERVVGLDARGKLAFLAGPAPALPGILPPGWEKADEGAIVEHSPAREALMEELAAHISTQGGAGLFIDYGHCEPGIGDTLQALSRHAPQDVLTAPGEADLTAHVDFAALARIAAGHGLSTDLTTQGDFLLAMGLLERAGTLGANAGEAVRARLQREVDRLARTEAMGELFKVLAIHPPGLALPPRQSSD